MLGIVYLLLCWSLPITAVCYTGIPGENLWRKTARIGSCIDIAASRVCVVAVDTMAWLSVLESVASMVESVEEELLGLSSEFITFQEFISSKLDAISDSISDSIVSEIDKIKIDLFSVSDAILIDLSIFDSDISSFSESILEVLESFGNTLSEELAELTACEFGTIITAADLAAGTFVISDPGVYSLCENVTTTFNPGISIQASNVTLDLNGYTIFYNASNGCAISVPTATQNNTIKNGFIEAITGVTNSCCIEVTNANTVYIIDITSQQLALTIQNATAVSIAQYNGIGSNAGIAATNTTELLIDMSTVTGSASLGTPALGITVTGGDAVVRQSTISQATSGITFDTVTEGLIEGCVVTSIANDAYELLNVTANAVIIDRSTATFAAIGILVSGSTAMLLRDCITNNCIIGVSLASALSTVIKRSVMTQNGIGILIDNLSANTTILESCPVDNTTNISDAGTNTIFINLPTVLEQLCSDIETFESVGESIIESMEELVLSLGDFVLTVIDAINETVKCLVETEVKQIDVPYTIPGPGVYTVCESLTFNGGPVITNTFSDVVINLNGHNITTDNRAIVSTAPGASNVVIKNGYIVSGLEALVIDQAEGAVIRNITIEQAANTGVRITNSQGILVADCIVCGNNTTDVGLTFPGSFYFANCGALIIQNCQAVPCNATPLVRGFSLNTISPIGGIFFIDCIASGTTQEAYRLGETSNDLSSVYLLRCQASNATTGFLVTHTSGGQAGPLFEACDATACTQGFIVDMTDSVLFNNCIADNSTTSGFLATASTDTVSAVACVSQNNGTGFTLNGAKPVCDRCSAISNSGTGFLMSASAVGAILYLCLASRNGLAGINDNNVAASAIVDTRSQDAAFGANPAYNLNTLPDVKGLGLGSVVIRTS